MLGLNVLRLPSFRPVCRLLQHAVRSSWGWGGHRRENTNGSQTGSSADGCKAPIKSPMLTIDTNAPLGTPTQQQRQRVRVAVVNTHPIQYFAPLYAYLNRDPTLEVTALYCSDFSLRDGIDPGFKRTVTWDVDLLQGYPHVFLSSNNDRGVPRGFWSLTCPGIWREIRSGKYDAVWLHGYNYAASVLAFVAAKSKRLPVLMRSETHLGLTCRTWRRRVRDTVLRPLYRFVDAFLAIGSANRTYYRSLGVPERRIFDVPYAVDNARFIAEAEEAGTRRDEIRRRYGLPLDQPVVLYASKLRRRKHPETVLHAMAALRKAGHRVTLFIVGSGEMEGELRELAAAGDQRGIVFAGFINQRELPQAYAACDIFVLPAEAEPWGLVVNEVMCAALPVVVSDQVGCAADLVRTGVNGYLFATGEVASLAGSIEKLLVEEGVRREMGIASREIISRWGFEKCRQGLTSALASVLPADLRRQGDESEGTWPTAPVCK
jgi:glycosyltransferase involved in cell wall biosynthesis